MLSPRCCDALRGESIGRLSICRVCAILSTNQNAATVSTSGVSNKVFHSTLGLNINFISSRNNAISYQLLRHHIYVKYFAFLTDKSVALDSIAMLMKGTADKVFGDFYIEQVLRYVVETRFGMNSHEGVS